MKLGPDNEFWMLDASMAGDTEDELGMYPFCPVELENGEVKNIMVGLTLVSDKPPGRCIGVFHSDGQEACDEWSETHQDLMATLTGPQRP